jgi:hypothetical protein
MEINVNGSENLWQVEFYYHVNFIFTSFKHENNNRRKHVNNIPHNIIFKGTNFQNLKQTWECCIFLISCS